MAVEPMENFVVIYRISSKVMCGEAPEWIFARARIVANVRVGKIGSESFKRISFGA